MRKILLPPIIFLFAVACFDISTIVATGDRNPQLRSSQSIASSAASANGRILPAAYATMMGEVNNSWPHARGNMRYQQVFLGTELGDMQKIAGLCLRQDEAVSGSQRSEDLVVKLGPTQMDNTNLGTSFDSNYSSPPTEVFSGSVVIPATTGSGALDSFDFCIDFTTQYVPPAGSNLIVEIINNSTSTAGHPKDACAAGAAGCTTRRVFAFSASAATATVADNSGLIMSFVGADPEEKVDCTDDKWADFGFTNQGQCIRFVETGKDSRSEQTPDAGY